MNFKQKQRMWELVKVAEGVVKDLRGLLAYRFNDESRIDDWWDGDSESMESLVIWLESAIIAAKENQTKERK